MNNSINKCEIVQLPRIHDPRGNLTFIQNDLCKFAIKRVYYLYDIPAESERGGHAHKALHQLIIPLSGSFDVLLDDGVNKRIVQLSRPYQALYVCPMIWRELNNFSSGAVCLVLASESYDESDYLRNYLDFINATKQ
jgi:uncharacterized RmlC-like cupin family protein